MEPVIHRHLAAKRPTVLAELDRGVIACAEAGVSGLSPAKGRLILESVAVKSRAPLDRPCVLVDEPFW